MNSLSKLRKITFLTEIDVEMLVSDVIDEEHVDSPSTCKNRHVIAWYLRYYHYLPFSLISRVLEYKGGSSAAEAVFTLMEICEMAPVSMHPNYAGMVQHYKHIADTYYDTKYNVFMDRGVDLRLKEALLYGASYTCNFVDKHNKVSWYDHTPKDSTLFNLFNILYFLDHTDDVDGLNLDFILDNYEIKTGSAYC
jgi:hypothetical protein